MKKVFIILLLSHSFQGFLLAQENLEGSSSSLANSVSVKRAPELKGNAMDDFDKMLDDAECAESAVGDIKPAAKPKKNKVNIIALCANLVKHSLAVTYENLMNLVKKAKNIL